MKRTAIALAAVGLLATGTLLMVQQPKVQAPRMGKLEIAYDYNAFGDYGDSNEIVIVVQSSTDMVNWTPFAVTKPGTIPLPLTNAKQFFRSFPSNEITHESAWP